MKTLPCFLLLEGKKTVVAGGGKVARQKVHDLLQAGAKVKVVAPEILKCISRKKNITACYRKFRASDVNTAAAVIAATSDPEVNRKVSEAAEKKGVPVNVVDDPEKSTFIFGATVKKGDAVISISTGGASPTLAAWLRNTIENAVPEKIGQAVKVLHKTRQKLLSSEPDQKKRRKKLIAAARKEISKLNLKKGS